MSRSPENVQLKRKPRRAGLTLVELMMAIAIMSLMAVVVGGLSMAVHSSRQYSEGQGEAVQHARVAMERIRRAVREAYATADHYGAAVISEPQGGVSYPDALVVWRPRGAPANPQGPPLFREIVVFCADPAEPHKLVELTNDGDSRPLPAFSQLDTATWRSQIDAFKQAPSTRKVVLTDLVRTGLVSGRRWAAVRFASEVRPSQAEWDAQRGGALNWRDMSWSQGVYGPNAGMRQVWVRFELQLMPGAQSIRDDSNGQQATPFFGSAALYYELKK